MVSILKNMRMDGDEYFKRLIIDVHWTFSDNTKTASRIGRPSFLYASN